MTLLRPAGFTRVLAAVAAFAASLAALPTIAAPETQITTGAIEVRGFYARAASDVYAAGYGSGLYHSTTQGASFVRVPLPANERYLTGVAGTTGLTIVGAEEGLLRSTNGTTFTRILHEKVSAIAVGSGTATTATVLAAIPGAGIFRSTNGGQTFTAANVSLMGSTDVTGLAISPANANTVYASVLPNKLGAGGGVYRSDDGGASWSNANANLPAAQQYLTSVVVDSAGTPYIGVLRPDNQGDVYHLSGGSWIASGDVFGGVVSLHRDANSGAVIWAGGRGFGLYTGATTNFQYSYAGVGTPNLLFTGVNATVSLPGSAVVVQAVRGAGIWRSTAAGNPRAWTRLAIAGADRVLSASNVGNSATAMLAGLHAGGLWRTNDATAGSPVWNPPNVGTDFNFIPPGNYATIFPWASIWDIYGSLTDPNLAYAAAGGVGMFYGNDALGIFRYSGGQWLAVNEAGNPLGAVDGAQSLGVAINTANNDIAYAGFLNVNGVRRRSGGTWTNIPIPGVAVAAVRRFVMAPSNPNKMLALLFDDKPALSIDGGASFAPVAVSQSGFERIRFFSAAEGPNPFSTWIAGTNKGIFRSVDFGSSWARVPMAGVFPQLAITAVGLKQSNSRFFAADIDGNRFCSADGATWVSAGTKLRAGVNAIRTFGGNLYYLTDGAGIFREDGTC
jgi:hypothetical protein